MEGVNIGLTGVRPDESCRTEPGPTVDLFDKSLDLTRADGGL